MQSNNQVQFDYRQHAANKYQTYQADQQLKVRTILGEKLSLLSSLLKDFQLFDNRVDFDKHFKRNKTPQLPPSWNLNLFSEFILEIKKSLEGSVSADALTIFYALLDQLQMAHQAYLDNADQSPEHKREYYIELSRIITQVNIYSEKLPDLMFLKKTDDLVNIDHLIDLQDQLQDNQNEFVKKWIENQSEIEEINNAILKLENGINEECNNPDSFRWETRTHNIRKSIYVSEPDCWSLGYKCNSSCVHEGMKFVEESVDEKVKVACLSEQQNKTVTLLSFQLEKLNNKILEINAKLDGLKKILSEIIRAKNLVHHLIKALLNSIKIAGSLAKCKLDESELSHLISLYELVPEGPIVGLIASLIPSQSIFSFTQNFFDKCQDKSLQEQFILSLIAQHFNNFLEKHYQLLVVIENEKWGDVFFDKLMQLALGEKIPKNLLLSPQQIELMRFIFRESVSHEVHKTMIMSLLGNPVLLRDEKIKRLTDYANETQLAFRINDCLYENTKGAVDVVNSCINDFIDKKWVDKIKVIEILDSIFNDIVSKYKKTNSKNKSLSQFAGRFFNYKISSLDKKIIQALKNCYYVLAMNIFKDNEISDEDKKKLLSHIEKPENIINYHLELAHGPTSTRSLIEKEVARYKR